MPPDVTPIFARYCPLCFLRQIDGSTLRTLCLQHGPLITFHLNLTQGNAVVRYSSKEEAAKAQKSLHMCVPSAAAAAAPGELGWGSLSQERRGAPQPSTAGTGVDCVVVLGLEAHGQGVGRARFLPKPLPLAHGRPPSPCPHLVVSPPEYVCVPASYEDTSHGVGSTLVTSFYLNHLFRDPLSKYRHIQRYGRLGLRRVNLRRHSAAHNGSCDVSMSSEFP